MKLSEKMKTVSFNENPFDANPRDYALSMVEHGYTSAEELLLACIKYMSHDEVRDMLDANELSPRFFNHTPDW